MASNNVRSAAFSTQASPPRYGKVRQFVTNAAKGPLKLMGLAVAAAMAIEYKNYRELEEDAEGDKKRVLVLPFHRMRLVEARRRGNLMIESLLAGDDADNAIMEDVWQWKMHPTNKHMLTLLCRFTTVGGSE
jgi:hypothetical protein